MLEVRLYVTWLFGPTQELAFPLKNEDPRSPSPLLYVAGYVVLAIPDTVSNTKYRIVHRLLPKWRPLMEHALNAAEREKSWTRCGVC